MKSKKVYFFIGTTAELIKLFPVIREMEARRADFKIITSGQTKIDFDEVKSWVHHITPDISLPGKANESSVLLFIFWALKCLFIAPMVFFKEFKYLNKKNILLVVHGDTVSALIGAITARICVVRLAHVESGLRSFNFLEPFPEEISRHLVSKLSDVHFCPNKWSIKNLKGLNGRKINTFQNTFIESFYLTSSTVSQSTVRKLSKGKYFIFVLHRQEHIFFEKNKSIKLAEFVINNKPAGMKCLFVKHLAIVNLLKSINGEYVPIPRLPYADFVYLLRNSEFIISDGGGNQEEAYYMGKPCLILRNRTERIEGLGENAVLAKGNKKTILDFLKNYKNFRKNKVGFTTRPSKIICDTLLSV